MAIFVIIGKLISIANFYGSTKKNWHVIKAAVLPLLTKVVAVSIKRPVYIFAFGEFNFQQVNVSCIQRFLVQFLGLELRKKILNAANIYLLGIKLTKCKYLDGSF